MHKALQRFARLCIDNQSPSNNKGSQEKHRNPLSGLGSSPKFAKLSQLTATLY